MNAAVCGAGIHNHRIVGAARRGVPPMSSTSAATCRERVPSIPPPFGSTSGHLVPLCKIKKRNLRRFGNLRHFAPPKIPSLIHSRRDSLCRGAKAIEVGEAPNFNSSRKQRPSSKQRAPPPLRCGCPLNAAPIDYESNHRFPPGKRAFGGMDQRKGSFLQNSIDTIGAQL